MFDVDVEGCRDSSSDNSSSDASSRLASGLSCYSSVTSNRDVEVESLEMQTMDRKAGGKLVNGLD